MDLLAHKRFDMKDHLLLVLLKFVAHALRQNSNKAADIKLSRHQQTLARWDFIDPFERLDLRLISFYKDKYKARTYLHEKYMYMYFQCIEVHINHCPRYSHVHVCVCVCPCGCVGVHVCVHACTCVHEHVCVFTWHIHPYFSWEWMQCMIGWINWYIMDEFSLYSGLCVCVHAGMDI